jgi:hypothetical protein
MPLLLRLIQGRQQQLVRLAGIRVLAHLEGPSCRGVQGQAAQAAQVAEVAPMALAILHRPSRLVR